VSDGIRWFGLGLAGKHSLQVTFFGDDIIISSDHPFMGLKEHVEEIVRSAGLRLNQKKSGPVAGPSERHGVLGIVMNSRGTTLDVPRQYRRKLRTALHVYRDHGPAELVERGFTSGDPAGYLLGKIAFAAQVNPRHATLDID